MSITVRQRPDGARRSHEYAQLPPSQRPRLDEEAFQSVYGADEADIERVVAFAQSHGLLVEEVLPQRRTVRVSGTAQQFNEVFDTPLRMYSYRGTTFRGRTGRVSVPAEVSDVIEGVFGLDNRPIARHRSQVVAPRVSTTNQLTPLEVAVAYDFPPGVDGTGQSIAIVEFGGGYRASDLTTFFGGLGLACPTVVPISIDGAQNIPTDPPPVPQNQPSTPGLPIVSGVVPDGGPVNGGSSVTVTGSGFTGATGVNFGGTGATSMTVNSDTQITAASPPIATDTAAVHVTVVNAVGSSNLSSADVFIYNDSDPEVALDIEVAGAIAPGARILVYFAPNTSAGWLDVIKAIVNDSTNLPSILSISWGGAEDTQWTTQQRSLLETEFVAASQKAQPMTIFAAAGDNGSSDDVSDGVAHVDYPASSPNVTGCGGSALTLAGTAWGSEIVWNNPSTGSGFADGTTGGGVSVEFPPPTWQSGASVPNSANGGQPGRGVPDVCGHADSYAIVLRGNTVGIGGTSAVAPLWAGLAARCNQQLNRSIGPLNDKLYQASVVSTFHDVTSGSNGSYNAGPGWDPCTGLGSPDGSKLLAALSSANQPTVTGLTPATGPTAGGTTVVIAGSGFTGATDVAFGQTDAASMNVDSDTQITA
ncbi:MAG: protease pro-enzyme activation domain-containing protein, partial [Acidimicrobiales bacterium]